MEIKMIDEKRLNEYQQFLENFAPHEIHNGRYFSVVDWDEIEQAIYRPYTKLVSRLKRIGIRIEVAGNVPWYYLDTVNGNKVKETFQSEHGFVIFMGGGRLNFDNPGVKFTDIKKIFEVIRKYR